MQNFTAMVIDDHYLVRQGFEAVARRIPGLSIIGSYERSRDLIAAIELCPPQVLYLDFVLHTDDVGGLTLIRLIKRRFPIVKIIVVSAHANAGIVSLSIRAGASGFCFKTSSVSDLTEATSRVLGGKVYIPKFVDECAVNRDLNDRPDAFEILTPREREVVNLILIGMSISDISKKLVRDRKTISGHKQTAYRKLGVSSDAELFSIKHLLM
ncbi:response regulator transcription factor [Burkholderia ambifaria]|uniref:Two component transcriptional regulator, LuxR family n=1 Tax=Burkholderia ambifaria MEX-5 TaxID=396597 RepID=B1T388_9BURK|nr:response regulator transcription factor [Burkholderia ambifaria]EDT41986.1 two component transcriptional regulator, LuxR family [Burkholderia ambifaria MEX-5]